MESRATLAAPIAFPRSAYAIRNGVNFRTPHTLIVEGTYVVASTRKPVNTPESARYTRIPSTGTPPFTYSSSDQDVATVDNAGQVTAWRNGVTDITATDHDGLAASYELTVKNITVMVPNDATVRNWSTAQSFANGMKSRLASVEELLAFYNLYAKERKNVASLLGWPLLDGGTDAFGAWTSTPGATGKHWFLNFDGSPAFDTGRVDGQDNDTSRRPTMCVDPASIATSKGGTRG